MKTEEENECSPVLGEHISNDAKQTNKQCETAQKQDGNKREMAGNASDRECKRKFILDEKRIWIARKKSE